MSETEAAEKRFVVDSMLGKVAKWLRILGFDTLYVRLAHQDQIDFYTSRGFFVITRTRRWCAQPKVFCPNSNEPMEQLRQVIGELSIARSEIRPLHRCIRCNRLLEGISRDQAFEHVPDYVFETNSIFYRCTSCQKVYWRGSHPKRMMDRLQRVIGWSV